MVPSGFLFFFAPFGQYSKGFGSAQKDLTAIKMDRSREPPGMRNSLSNKAAKLAKVPLMMLISVSSHAKKNTPKLNNSQVIHIKDHRVLSQSTSVTLTYSYEAFSLREMSTPPNRSSYPWQCHLVTSMGPLVATLCPHLGNSFFELKRRYHQVSISKLTLLLSVRGFLSTIREL